MPRAQGEEEREQSAIYRLAGEGNMDELTNILSKTVFATGGVTLLRLYLYVQYICYQDDVIHPFDIMSF